MPSSVRRVVNRDLQLSGGLSQRIVYWLCHDSTPSGTAGTFYIKCHLTEKLGQRVVREAVAISGSLGESEELSVLTFDLLAAHEVPVRPENLSHLAQDLHQRAVSHPSPAYSDLFLATRAKAAAMASQLRRKRWPAAPVVGDP